MAALNPDTPLDEVIKTRAKLVALAQIVFDRKSRDSIRAVSQFGKNAELGDLITAKREGVFDYGVCVQETDTGWTWPPAPKVLEALAKAKDGDLAEDDMEDLGLAGEDLPKVLMLEEAAAAPKKGKKTAAPKVKQEEPQPEASEPEAPRVDTKKPKNTNTAQSGSGDAAMAADIQKSFEELDAANEDRATALAGLIETGNEKSSIALRGLVGMLEAIYNRQDQLAARQAEILDNILPYLDPESEVELTELSSVSEEAIEDIKDGLGFDSDEGESAPEKPPTRSVKPSAKQEEPKDEEDEEEPESEDDEEEEEEDAPKKSSSDNGATSGGTLVYTKDALEAMDRDKLVELAQKIGIPKADKVAYQGVLIRKILKHQQAD